MKGEMDEFVVGLAIAAVDRKWPQPITFSSDSFVEVTPNFAEFHRERTVRDKLVLMLKVEGCKMWFMPYWVLMRNKLFRKHMKAYNSETHFPCLVDNCGKLRFMLHAYSRDSEAVKVSRGSACGLPADYANGLSTFEKPCGDEWVEEAVEPDTGYVHIMQDAWLDMEHAKFHHEDFFALLEPLFLKGKLVCNGKRTLSVHKVEDALQVQAQVHSIVSKKTYKQEWTPNLLKSLRLV